MLAWQVQNGIQAGHRPSPYRTLVGIPVIEIVCAAIALFASLLDERQRRLFAGLESLKCGWGGDRRIATARQSGRRWAAAPFAFESARMVPSTTLLLVAGGRERNYG